MDKIGEGVVLLPQGNYTLVGWSTELTETDCVLFMPECNPEDDCMLEGFYYVYGVSDTVTEYALSSFRSLLRSHDIGGERVLILRKID